MVIHAMNKGKRGEREVVGLLQPVVNQVYENKGLDAPVIERNLVQTRAGGYDLIGIDWMAVEVKFQEQELLRKWWEQTLKQAGEDKWPVLFFRKSRKPWQIKTLIWSRGKNIPVVMTVEDFLDYFRGLLEESLGLKS